MKRDYKFPLYPFKRDYSQTLVFKTTIDIGFEVDEKMFHSSNSNSNSDIRYVEDVLENYKMIDNLTIGIPKISILVGFQQGGHDRQYPEFSPINDRFRSRENPNLSPRDALVYMMEQAQKLYNTQCTVHANLVDGYEDSRIWQEYIDNDAICRNEDGGLVTTWYDEANKRQGYGINVAKAWETGLIQTQIDNLMEMLPNIVKSKVIYFDANCVFRESPAIGTTKEDQIVATKLIAQYIREKYDCDVIGEYGLDVQYGYVPHGLTWDGHSGGNSINPMKLAPYIMAGGTANCGGCTQMDIFGYSIQLGHLTNLCDEQEIKREFFTQTVPYFYLNSKLRLSYDETNMVATFSDNVKSYISEDSEQNPNKLKNVITQDDIIIKDGNNIFCPVSWIPQNEILVYSKDGMNKTFLLPKNFAGVNVVDIYELSAEAPLLVSENVAIVDNKIAISIKPDTALVVKAREVRAKNKYTHTSATFIGYDYDTKGNWESKYANSTIIMPSYINGEDVENIIITGMSIQDNPSSYEDDDRVLTNSQSKVYECELHSFIDVSVNSEKEIAFYLCDYDLCNRQTLVEAINRDDNTVCDVKILSEYTRGVYLNYKINGNVRFRFTRFYGDNMQDVGKPVVCGIYID